MKIQLQTTYDAVKLTAWISDTFSTVAIHDDTNRNKRTVLSILEDVRQRFENKALSLREKKAKGSDKTKLSLKYHEAVSLERALEEYQCFVEDPYHKALLSTLIFQLNQKTV
ncbi:MAG: hypothetical protein Q4G08_04115 [Capnocytophaga sp.]|nr:hypothetical protein [Capnocytophaga sp.]